MSDSALRRLAVLAVLGCASASALDAQQPPFPFQDPTLPVDQRVDDLVGRMTLEEKAGQLVNRTRAIPRLNVPEYNIWSEALHGVAGGGFATVFPQAIGLGATFDAPALHEMAAATAREARVKYNQAARAGRAGRMMGGLTFFSPNINIFRDPRWGRGQETYGEDPFLTARLGVAFITGLQGDDPAHPVVTATAKHYAVHSGPEPLRHGFDARVSAHDVEDTYLPAFRAAVVEGKVKSVMCVYNAVNGVPGCASELLQPVVPLGVEPRRRRAVDVEVAEVPAGDQLGRPGRRHPRPLDERAVVADLDRRVEEQARLLLERHPAEEIVDALVDGATRVAVGRGRRDGHRARS